MAKLAMGELEAAVMDVLWDADGPLIPAEVHLIVAAQRPLAYTTVMTILVRLWKKERLDRRSRGLAYAYEPKLSREEHAAARMGEQLVAAKDRPLALGYFVAGLKGADRERLRHLLASHGTED